MRPGVLLLVLAAAPMFAQSLQVQPSTAARGSSGSFLIVLSAPDGNRPAALQWNIRLPNGITVAKEDIVAGSSAASAQKVLTCATRSDDKQPAKQPIYVCILAGGAKPILNGTIAAVRYQVLDKAQAGAATVRVENIAGVTAGLKKIDIAAAKGAITVK